MAYDENSIRVLSPEEIKQRFDWVRIGDLVHEYNLPVDWVRRGFEACWRLNIEPDYFINKYILKHDVDPVPDFEAVFKEIIMESRFRDQVCTRQSQKRTCESDLQM